MFSGLGSITDLNNQFAQFTSNLTNLDSLQDGTSNSGTNQVAAGGKCDSQVDVTSLEKHIFELQIKLAQQESESEATNSTLLACQQDLLQEKSVTATLQIELRTVCEEKDEICAQLEAFKVKSQKEKSTLRSKLQRLEADAKGAGKLHTEEVAKEPDPEIDFLNVRLQTTASELETARSNITDLETRLAAAETSATELTQQYESQSQGSTAKMDQLEKDIQGLLSNIVELSEENGSLRTRLAVSEGHCKALEAQLEQTTASATDRDVAISSSLDEAQILKRALGEKDAQVEELQVQAGTLKDKLKDMMHRFAELKAKSGSQIQHLEERVAEVTQLMQAKDSEILSCRMKLENTDRSSSDLRLKATELAERFGEAQREITRLRESLEERQAQVEALAAEKACLEQQALTAATNLAELSAQLSDTEARCTALQTLHAQELHVLMEGKDRELRAGQEVVARLQAELAEANNRARAEEDSADNLDNYKKRAQLALKKANSAAAQLSAELQQLQVALDDANAKLLEAQESARLASEGQQKEAARADALRACKLELESALQQQQNVVETLQHDWNAKIKVLEDKVAEQGREQMYNSSNYFTGVKEGDKDRAGAASGFVSISKSGPSEAGAASADSAVVDEDAASLMSVGADSTASSAAQESGTIPHSNNKNSSSNVRESSWAMVAAASASGSGAGSAALSVASTNTNEEGGAVVVTGGDGNGAPLGDSSDFRTTLSSDSLLFISQLQAHLESTKRSLAQRGIDLEAAHQQLQYERDEKRVLKNRVEELLAFLDRTKQLHEGPNSATNMEYLKNCILKFMSSSDLSEKRRLYPVIATILKLTSQEMKNVEVAFQVCEERENEFQNTLASIGTFATSSIGSLWGSVLGGGGGGGSRGDRPSSNTGSIGSSGGGVSTGSAGTR